MKPMFLMKLSLAEIKEDMQARVFFPPLIYFMYLVAKDLQDERACK